jgi:hypothetical protein
MRSRPTRFYMPTGRYANGASDNTGLGNVGPRADARDDGVYSEPGAELSTRQSSRASTSRRRRKAMWTRVGNAMNLEGGVGGDFLHGGLTLGLVYYAYVQTDSPTASRDSQLNIEPAKSKVFALGPEASFRSYGTVFCSDSWKRTISVKPTREPRRRGRVQHHRDLSGSRSSCPPRKRRHARPRRSTWPN